MQPNKEDQILSLITQNSSVLICLPEQPTTDAIAAGLALLSLVEKLGKRAKVVSSGFTLPVNHSFLPKSNEIFDDVSALRKFVISLNISKTSVEELTYAIDGDQMKIYIAPKDGYFHAEDVSTEDGVYAYDLIIALDAQGLEQFGRIYDMNADFFYHTPVINIDHNPANDHFGQVNLVNVTATSTSEIVFELIQHADKELLDEYIATNLLTGIISKTKSFQSGSVTPRSLAIASHLISQGARREEIVRHLYQSKKISTLKLWGRALSKLQSDPQSKIVWSVLSEEDITETHAQKEDLSDVIDELITNTPDARNIFILYQQGNQVSGFVSTSNYINALTLFADLAPTGSEHFISFETSAYNAEELQRRLLERLQKQNSGAG